MLHKVTSYKDLEKYVHAFRDGALEVLIIEGSAGSGKSNIARQAFAGLAETEYCWLEGRLSAPYLYEQAYRHVDCPIILDDVDGLYADKNAVMILKQLCQTDRNKRVSWGIKTRLNDDIPKEFETSSRVCLITNSWRRLNKHVAAVEDRGLVINFYPDASTVHKRAKELKIADSAIMQFIGEYVSTITRPSLRHYINAQALKNSGIGDWKNILIESFETSETEQIVIQLIEDASIKSSEKAKEFARKTGKSERHFYRIKKHIKS